MYDDDDRCWDDRCWCILMMIDDSWIMIEWCSIIVV